MLNRSDRCMDMLHAKPRVLNQKNSLTPWLKAIQTIEDNDFDYTNLKEYKTITNITYDENNKIDLPYKLLLNILPSNLTMINSIGISKPDTDWTQQNLGKFTKTYKLNSELHVLPSSNWAEHAMQIVLASNKLYMNAIILDIRDTPEKTIRDMIDKWIAYLHDTLKLDKEFDNYYKHFLLYVLYMHMLNKYDINEAKAIKEHVKTSSGTSSSAPSHAFSVPPSPPKIRKLKDEITLILQQIADLDHDLTDFRKKNNSNNTVIVPKEWNQLHEELEKYKERFLNLSNTNLYKWDPTERRFIMTNGHFLGIYSRRKK